MPSIHIVYSLISTFFKMLSALLMLAVFAHSLSGDDYAILITAIFIAQLSSIFIDGGVNNELLSIKSNANGFHEKIALTSAIRFSLYLFSSILISIYFFFFDGLYSGFLFIFGFMSGAISLILETYSIKLKTEYKFLYELRLTVIVNMASVFFAYISFFSEYLVFVAILVPRLFAIFLFGESLGLFKCLHLVSVKSIWNSFSRLKYFSIDSIASSLSLQLDSIFLLLFFGKEVYASFQPLSKIYQAGIGFSSAISTYAIPKAHSLTKKMDKLFFLLKTFSFFAIVGSVVYFFLSGYVVNKLFGGRFSIDTGVIFLFSMLFFVRYLCASFGSFLMLEKKQKIRAKINTFVTLFCLPLMFFANDYVGVLKVVVLSQITISLLYIIQVFYNSETA